MAQPVFYQTLNMVGIDPTIYYTNLATAGGSITPEYPAPPFIPGTRAFGSDGSEFIFVQASQSIALTDFVLITAQASSGSGVANPFTANSITTTNVSSSFAIELASAGLVLKQSVTLIPGGAMFWACTKGAFIPATTSGTLLNSTATAGAVYTTATPGALTSSGVSASILGGFAGITVISSVTLTAGISTIPPAGTLTGSGFTQGPVVSLNKVRTIDIVASVFNTSGGQPSLSIFW